MVSLLGGQDGGGLVQDQQVRSPVEHLYDLHRLFLGDRHIIYFFIKIKLETVTVRQFTDIFQHFFHINNG